MNEKTRDTVPITEFPERENIIFCGKSWKSHRDNFSDRLYEKHPHINQGDKTMRFTATHAGFLYARINTVARYCLDEFDDPHTVWLSLTAEAKSQDGKWFHPLRHDDGFRSNAVRQSLYRATPKAENYAGLWLHAPRRTGYSHRHYALWVNGEVTSEDFEPVIRSHVRNHPTATEEGNPPKGAIHVRSSGQLMRLTTRDGNHEKDVAKGSTTALTKEVGNNLPSLGTDPDIREGRYCDFLWAAMLWADDRTQYKPLGRFAEIADKQ
jgi:hypothetical protein